MLNRSETIVEVDLFLQKGAENKKYDCENSPIWCEIPE